MCPHTNQPPISPARLAATEYILFHDPERTQQTPFGWFTTHPGFPTRHDANQLFDVRCRPGETAELLATLETLYAGTDRPFRKLTFHDEDTAQYLVPALRERGWSCEPCWMMVWERDPERPINPDVGVTVVPFEDPDGILAQIALINDGNLDSFRYHQYHDPRQGGEALLGSVDGQPVGKTGWFVVDGVARFRPVDTIPEFRGRGVATTLIRHVQTHPAVRAADALTIFCDDDGPTPLYEALGFVKRHVMWSCLLADAV